MTIPDWLTRWSHILPPEAAAELTAALDPCAAVMPEPGTGSEARMQSLARKIASVEFKTALFRNNVGAMTTDDGRHVRFGLGNDSAALNRKWKSSDLIGVGPDGQFVAVEVKKPGWHLTAGDHRAQAQAAFMKSVIALGGRAGFVQSENDVRNLLTR